MDTKTELYFSWKIIFETKAKYENKNTWTTGMIYNQSKKQPILSCSYSQLVFEIIPVQLIACLFED